MYALNAQSLLYCYANGNNVILFNIRHKYIEHVLSKPTTTSMRKKRDKQVCESTNNNVYANNNVIAIEFSRNQQHELFTSRTYICTYICILLLFSVF